MGPRGRIEETRVTFGEHSRRASGVPGIGRSGALAGGLVLLLVVGGFVWAAVGATVPPAERPVLFGGSLVLEDQRPLTVIDVATGHATIRLQGVYNQVGARGYGDVEAIALDDGTLLLDRNTGTFNLLARDDYVVDNTGSGVGLGALSGSTGAGGFADGASAYIVRYAPSSTVTLIDASTVRDAARMESRAVVSSAAPAGQVAARGFASLNGPVADRPGSAAVDPVTGDLWVLVGEGGRCDVVQLHPNPSAAQGLLATTRVALPVGCTKAAVASGGGVIGVASPGRLTVFTASGNRARATRLAGTASASGFVPVTGTKGGILVLAHSPRGWVLTGATAPRWQGNPSRPLGSLGADAAPAPPVMSAGSIYTLDQASPGQPTLWQIDPTTAQMSPVAGESSYPARGPTEKASFEGAQILADGPRVVFNNPGSLLAVVVFTDGSHRPLVVDKSEAVTVSATGPADLSLTPSATLSGDQTDPVGSRAVPVVQAVSQQVTCATTTQKPYAPQISAVSAASDSALISWTYQLLDQTDCEPDSWSVKVTALSTSHQPGNPDQIVNGQNQLLFTGLRPATTYAATVTAYINRQSTTSPTVTFTTSARGPDAPATVDTTSDGRGDWVVSWAPCSAPDCYVPADMWNVIGTACGTGYVGQPPVVQVPGDQYSVTINADSLGLLGESLTFAVQGTLASGLEGGTTRDGSCTQAWRPADSSVITLDRSSTQHGQTVTVNLQVAATVPAVEAFGSRSTEFIFRVGGETVGPTETPTATVPGLAPGVAYTPSVTIYPSGHPEAAAVVSGAPLTPTLQWPANMGVSVQPTVDQSDPNQGNLDLSFSNLPPGPMQATGSYTCGSTEGPSFGGQISAGVLQVGVDLIDYGGDCRLTARVSDSDQAPYGGTSSPPLTADFAIGTQPRYAFTAQISQSCQQSLCAPEQIEVLYSGPGSIDRGGDWAIRTASTGSGKSSSTDPCAETDQLSTPAFPVTVNLPDLCLDPHNVDVSVIYTYLGSVVTFDAGTPSGGTPSPPTTTPPASARPGTSTAGAAGGFGLAAVSSVSVSWAGLVRRKWNRKRVRTPR